MHIFQKNTDFLYSSIDETVDITGNVGLMMATAESLH
jgi:hypothetical protein